jgi:hypothetical protein
MDRPKLPLFRLLIPTVALVLVGAGGLWAWQSWRSQQRSQQTRVDNQTVEAVRQDLSITIAASGTVQPITPVNISPLLQAQGALEEAQANLRELEAGWALPLASAFPG